MNAAESLKIDAERVSKLIDRQLAVKADAAHKTLYDAMRYSALAGGKRLRPHLCYEFCRACGGEDAQADAYAVALELLHTYSLIHDDLPAMDNDDLRRGKPTCHKVYGEATAILAGDALLTEAMGVMANNSACSDEQNMTALVAFTEAAGVDGMVGGQQIDLQSESETPDTSVLFDMHMRKTGALIACSCIVGCIAAGAERGIINVAGEFGSCLGLAFQITDDLLDCEGSTESMGKTIGKDEKAGKTTFVTLLGADASRRIAAELTDKAKNCLEKLSESEAASRLSELCDNLLARTN